MRLIAYTFLTLALGCLPARAEVDGLGALMLVQSRVQQQLPHAEAALVALDSQTGAASGVIVSAEGLLLTAAHVVQGFLENGARDGVAQVLLADGSRATAKALGRDLATDAGMMQLQGPRRDWPHVRLGRGLEAVRVGDWCFALGHPGGHNAARGAVLRVGKVLKLSANAVQTDCVLMGGDSGGPLLNLRGELVGINSQIWEGRDQNAHVSLAPYLRSWQGMLKGKVITEWAEGSGGWLGVATSVQQQGGLVVDQVAELSPAAQAGLLEGDVLLQAEGQSLRAVDDLALIIACHLPGDAISLRLSRAGKEQTLMVKLTPRPTEQP